MEGEGEGEGRGRGRGRGRGNEWHMHNFLEGVGLHSSLYTQQQFICSYNTHTHTHTHTHTQIHKQLIHTHHTQTQHKLIHMHTHTLSHTHTPHIHTHHTSTHTTHPHTPHIHTHHTSTHTTHPHTHTHLPEDQECLDHLLPQVVVNTVYLVFSEHAGQMACQLSRAVRVLAKGLLHDDAVPTPSKKSGEGRRGGGERRGIVTSCGHAIWTLS